MKVFVIYMRIENYSDVLNVYSNLELAIAEKKRICSRFTVEMNVDVFILERLLDEPTVPSETPGYITTTL